MIALRTYHATPSHPSESTNSPGERPQAPGHSIWTIRRACQSLRETAPPCSQMSRSHVMYSLGGTVVMPSDHIGHSNTEPMDAMSYELDGIVTPEVMRQPGRDDCASPWEDQDTASMAAGTPVPPAEVPDSPDQGICDEFAAACGDAVGLRVTPIRCTFGTPVVPSPEGMAKAAEEASPPMTAEAALRQAEAEGLSLVRSDNKTGYSCVDRMGKRFQAYVQRGGGKVTLGTYGTPEEAALWVARSPEGKAKAAEEASPPMTAEAALRQAEAEGLSLVRSDNQTGYSCVNRNGKRFRAYVQRGGGKVTLGTYDTPEEAALWVARSPEGKAKAAAAATPAEPADKRKATETSAEVVARVAAAARKHARKKRRGSAGPLDDGRGHRSGEECAYATLRAAQPRMFPLTADDDMTAVAPNRFAAREAKRLAHRAVTTADGGESRTFVIDASTSASQLNFDADTLRELKAWHEAFVSKNSKKTAGNKRSRLVKKDMPEFDNLWAILKPVYGKLGFKLFEANAIVYPDGEISFIYPHLDAHYHFKERLTIVLELTPTTKPEETLHFMMANGEEMRMPRAAEGEQLLSVSTSGAMTEHFAYVSGESGERRSLALFLYLEEFEDELEEGEDQEPFEYPSGALQAMHDARVGQLLQHEPRRELVAPEAGSPSMLQAIYEAAASECDGSAKPAASSSSGSDDRRPPQPRGAPGLGSDDFLMSEASQIRHGLARGFNDWEWQGYWQEQSAREQSGALSGSSHENCHKMQAPRGRGGRRSYEKADERPYLDLEDSE